MICKYFMYFINYIYKIKICKDEINIRIFYDYKKSKVISKFIYKGLIKLRYNEILCCC